MPRSLLLLAGLMLLVAPRTAAAQEGPTDIQPPPPPPPATPAPPPAAPPVAPPVYQPYPQPYPQQPYPQPYPPIVRVPPSSPYGDVLGLGLRVGAIVPFGDGYAGSPGGGMLIDASFWYEGKYFAIEPRVGVRFDLVRGPNSYVEVPLDVGGYVVLGVGGSVAVFGGGGLGARHIWETRGEDIVLGSVLPSRVERRSDDDGWGFGAFGRVGVIFARSYRARIILSVEYNVTVVELNGFRTPTSLTAGVGFVR
jgi:hypothetical protein